MAAIRSETDVIEAVRAAREARSPLEIVAGGTRRGFGRPTTGTVLDVSGLAGIVNYEPEELIVTLKPGTPLREIETVLAGKGQRLGFDPADWSTLFGATGTATLGGAISADASGAVRVRHGAARDQLLGFRGVNGFGEAFKAGGHVVKNVTGFDIPKLVCGAMGTLCVLTELTFRVFPKPKCAQTFAVMDVAPEPGLALLRRAWSSVLEPTGLAYVPAPLAELSAVGQGAALIRIEGAREPLNEKSAMLRELLTGQALHEIPGGDDVFRGIGCGAGFAGQPFDVWRVAVPPVQAAGVIAAVVPPLWFADWAGALLWVGLPPSDIAAAKGLRASAEAAGGHATLLRADEATRLRIPVFPPEAPARTSLTRAVKAAFDPLGLFNRGRMYEGI